MRLKSQGHVAFPFCKEREREETKPRTDREKKSRAVERGKITP